MTAGDARFVDAREQEKFGRMADHWWDESGPMRPLHRLNPARLAFLRSAAEAHFARGAGDLAPLRGLSALDVGCGAGLLSEPLNRLGATVTGIDATAEVIEAARAHAAEQALGVDYRVATVEDLVAEGRSYDLVVASEVVEHVPDPEAFLAGCSRLVAPGGALMLSTLNRTPKAFMLAIVGAEYLLRLVPRGTHDWRRFLRPSEVAAALRRNGLIVRRLEGLVYNPFDEGWRLSRRDLSINYLLFAARPRAADV